MDRTSRFLALALLLTAVASLGVEPAAAQNPIAIENTRPGAKDWTIPVDRRVTWTDWTMETRSRAEIEGYASLTSVANGDTIGLFVNTAESAYQMRIFRLGWYGGAGAREMLRVDRPGTVQPTCPRDPVTSLISCNWRDPYELRIPDDWVSGIYLVKLTASVSRRENYMVFVVRDTRSADFLFLSAVNTFQAYNRWGGESLYSAARKVSFDRPYAHWETGTTGAGEVLTWEVNMIRWLEREGYDVSYGTNVDLHTATLPALRRYKALLSVGHDEYWSWEMRDHAEQARDNCVNLGFFSANSVYWQVRFEPSPATGAADRVMVGYRNHALTDDPLATDARLDNDYLITTQWRVPRPGYMRPKPEDALLGVMYAFSFVDDDIVIAEPGHWAFSGVTTGRMPGLIGYEADRMYGNAPPGTVRLAHSPVRRTGGDYDCEPAAGNCASDMTVYTAPSGARVFATGTIDFLWGLDDFAAPGFLPRGPVQAAVQQTARNVLADLATAAACSFTLELPPARLADITVVMSDVIARGRAHLIECLANGTCGVTARALSSDFPSVMLYGRGEMAQAPPLPVPAPAPASHTLIGSRWHLTSDAVHKGPVWVTLDYGPLKLSPTQAASLDLLYVVQTSRGPVWRVAPTTRDTAADAIQARLPRLSTVMLGLRRK